MRPTKSMITMFFLALGACDPDATHEATGVDGEGDTELAADEDVEFRSSACATSCNGGLARCERECGSRGGEVACYDACETSYSECIAECPPACMPDWALIHEASDYELCYVDKDRHFGYFTLEFYVADRYRDLAGCEPDSYSLREIESLSCPLWYSTDDCFELANYVPVTVNKDRCPTPRR